MNHDYYPDDPDHWYPHDDACISCPRCHHNYAPGRFLDPAIKQGLSDDSGVVCLCPNCGCKFVWGSYRILN